MIRLQKYLSDSGVGSRREAENLIATKRIQVNGREAFLGQSVDPENDRVTLDGETVRPPRNRIYIAMNKPRGVICTASDPQGRRTVYHLLPDLPAQVHTVGRLDLMSEGLLILTNDGDLTRELTRSATGIERVYEVKIQGGVPDWALTRLEKGVKLDDGHARASRCVRLRHARTNEWLEVVITEGRYREVRRMFQALGMNVLKLKRVRFGSLSLGRLPIGAVRTLSSKEIEALRENRQKVYKIPKCTLPTSSRPTQAPVDRSTSRQRRSRMKP
jgi:23S rRNA pseudouridine2605 synthase